MSKEKRQIEKKDLITPEIYSKNRKKLRSDLVEYKKSRRVPIGPYATLYFESFETMLGQVQEMLHIEKGGDTQLADELYAYNPLIPKGKELVATLMFEIDDPFSRTEFLGKVGAWANQIDAKRFAGLEPQVLKSMQEERYRSAEKMISELGIEPKPIEPSIKEAYQWFQQHGYC